MKNFVLFSTIMVSFWCQLLPAQPIIEADLETITEMAEEHLLASDYFQALKYYQKSYRLHNDWHTAEQIANIQMKLRDYQQAVHWYRIAMEGDHLSAKPILRYRYALALKMSGAYEDARQAFLFFESINQDPAYAKMTNIQLEGIQKALDQTDDPRVEILVLEESVNTKFTESSPFFIDDQYFVFGSFDTDLIEDYDRSPKELLMQLYITSLNDLNTDRQPFQSIPGPDGWHNNSYSITPDGQYQLFGFSLLKGNTIVDTKHYVQEKLSTGWSEPYLIDHQFDDTAMRHVQISYWQGKPTLFFSMEDPDHISKMDIYYCYYIGQGKISYPTRLSNNINSPQDDITPFFYKNRLYFSSDGHPSYGGLDIYVSSWDGKDWSAAYHLGKKINSSADDFSYVTNRDGSVALLVSNRPGGPSLRNPTCCDNLFMVKYKEIQKPSVDPQSEQTAQNTSPETQAPPPTNDLGIDLNEPILLPNIQFEKGTTNYSKNAKTDLDLLYNVLIEYPDWIIELSAHSDAVGDDDQNLKTTQEQADKMQKYLVDRGIATRRIIARGYGEQYILNQCVNDVLCSEEDHSYNRRVEFKWIGLLSNEQESTKTAKDSLPIMIFDKKLYDLGTIKEGETKSAILGFTNTGNADLVIELATACTCTELDWPALPIKPGARGEIKITYDSKGKKGLQEVTVDVLANTDPIVVEAFFKIMVKPK